MSLETLSSRLNTTSEIFGGQTLDSFILSAIHKGVVDGVNASRLLASDIVDRDKGMLRPETVEGLYEINQQHDGERVENRIIAPVLRVIGDFRDSEYIYTQVGKESTWAKTPQWGIDEAVDSIVIEDFVNRGYVHIEPTSLSIFTEQDYNTLQKPPQGQRRAFGVAMASMFALGLSGYDKQLPQYPTVSGVYRHFSLGRIKAQG